MTINQRDHVVGLLDHEEWNLQHLKTRSPDQSAKDMMSIVKQWHAENLAIIGTKPWMETWSDFTNAWQKVKCLEGEGPLESTYRSIDMSQDVPPQLTALGYDQDIFRVVELCRLLAKRGNDCGKFFLSSRELARLISMAPNSASKILLMLVSDGILEIIEPGAFVTDKGPRATTYRYVGWQ